MMSRLSVATHISIALALITASLLLLAHSIGLVPDPRASRIRSREMVAELVARCAVEDAADGSFNRVIELARDLKAREPDVLSVGVRMADGSLVASTSGHDELREGSNRYVSTASQARVPILRDGAPWGEVEIRFKDLEPGGITGWVMHPLAPLLLFAVSGGFLVYRVYMRRVLRYLDPSAVIPERVRLVLDALAEGVMLLDNTERVVLINRAMGRMLGCGLEQVIGRAASSYEWLDLRTKSPLLRAPWIETIEDGALRAGIRLQLTGADGKVVTLSVACAPVVAAGGRHRGVVVTLADLTEVESQKGELESLVRSVSESHEQIARQNMELQRLATTDPLTECLNRRALFERGELYASLAARRHSPMACIMMDVDRFKRINDEHGHQAGDAVLRKIGKLLRDAARTPDIVGRYGGEEFCVVLPDTDEAGASLVAERIRESIEGADLEGMRVTASFGVADNRLGTVTLAEMFEEADRALYQAKRSGRNQVVVAGELPPRSAAA